MITAHSVIDATLKHYRLPPEAARTTVRARVVARPRQVAMYLVSELCPHISSPRLGQMMGGRNHTTILSGKRRIEKLILTDPDLARDVQTIRTAIMSVSV